MSNYICPLCDNPLSLNASNQGLSCANNHQFDRAKQGYFNLLPVQRKKSKEPGDSKVMINARQDFLAGDYYLPLANKIAEKIESLITEDSNFTMLDLGCGEGYYSRQIKQQLPQIIQYGIDISKPAIIKAAQADKSAHYAVASSDKLPYPDSSIDLALKVYAPANDNELHRVIKSGGYLLTITPAPRHLWQLREFIYQDVRAHDTQDTKFEGFELQDSTQFSYTINPNTAHRMALLQMTPFAWRANEAATNNIEQATNLTIELDFIINLYRAP